ncbi:MULTISPECIES: ferredoxin [unclassified Streptomyces]|uniref:ferredoxin n=1 Tax=unclassified Streptomyces TaxID=2593676 RepID=UPI002E32E9C3|nr:ferredoxin [Streptomyces sp. NBC_01477]
MKVIVDQNRCVASGQCVLAAEDVFDQRDEDGVVVLRDQAPGLEREDDVHYAALMCPAQAILVKD